MSSVSNLGLIPQLHCNGNFVGTADEIQELEDWGELADILTENRKPPVSTAFSTEQSCLPSKPLGDGPRTITSTTTAEASAASLFLLTEDEELDDTL